MIRAVYCCCRLAGCCLRATECAIVKEEKRKEVDELEGLKSVRPSFFYPQFGGSARGLFHPPQITKKSY